MKNRLRIIAAFLCIFFVLFAMSAPAFALSADTENVYRGDINQDGTVSAEDARRILRYAVRLEKLSGLQYDLADVDGDSQVTSCDARKALRMAVGLDKMIIYLSEGVINEQDLSGRYVVTGTGDYGLKVKPQPGYGEAAAMLYDGDEIVVMQVTEWAEADDESLRFWGSFIYNGYQAYVCMAYLEKVYQTIDDYTLGKYVVDGTDAYGLKVKHIPGYGDAIDMIYDGYEVEVLEIVEWTESDDEYTRFWGKIIYNGEEAYVAMEYLDKID